MMPESDPGHKQRLLIDKAAGNAEDNKRNRGGIIGAMIPPEAINPTERLIRVVCGAHRHQQRGDRSGIRYRRAGKAGHNHCRNNAHVARAAGLMADRSFIGRSTIRLDRPPAFMISSPHKTKKEWPVGRNCPRPLTRVCAIICTSNISVCHQSSAAKQQRPKRWQTYRLSRRSRQ